MVTARFDVPRSEPRGWVEAQRHKARAARLRPHPTLKDLLYAVVLILVTEVGTLVGTVLGLMAFDATGAAVAGTLTSVLVASVSFWVLFLRRWSWNDLGFRHGRHSLWHLAWQIPAALGATTLLFTIVGLALDIMSLRPGGVTPAEIEPDRWSVLVLTLGPSLVVAVIHEVLFRRILLDRLLMHVPVVAAVAITVVVFAAAHLDAPSILYSLFLGLALTAARLWYGTLWAPVIMVAVMKTLALSAVLLGVFWATPP